MHGSKLPLRTWFGYHYPAATPRELVVRMNSELRRTMDSPAFRTNIMDRIGLIPAAKVNDGILSGIKPGITETEVDAKRISRLPTEHVINPGDISMAAHWYDGKLCMLVKSAHQQECG